MINKILNKFGYKKTKYPTIDELIEIVRSFLDYLGRKHKKTYTFRFSKLYPHFEIGEVVPLNEKNPRENNPFVCQIKNICLCNLVSEYCCSTPEEFFNFLGKDILKNNKISPYINGFVCMNNIDKECGAYK